MIVAADSLRPATRRATAAAPPRDRPVNLSLDRLLIVDLVGFDRRRITAEHAPTCHRLFETFPAQRMDGQPTTEVWPALVTGTNPGAGGHLLWHARLRPDVPVRDHALGRLFSKLPERVVTAAQLVPHFFLGHRYDVPAIPRWRRRRLEFHRLKYHVRSLDPDKYNVVGGAETMFHAMGDDARHEVIDHFEDVQAAAERYPTGHRLQFLEYHCFDLVSHWYLDKPGVMQGYIRQIDDAIATLEKRCKAAGVTLALLIEHGQEAVPRENHVDLQKLIAGLGLPREEYCYYNGVAVAKFWFETDRAREAVTAAVKTLPHCRVVTREEMNDELGMTLTREWGELYVVREAGHLFHPHDYYHPLGNIVVGLRKKEMRQRMFDPYHRGYHGYWPGQPSEDAWSLVADDRVEPMSGEARLMDFAPSVLSLLGEAVPGHMKGEPTYRFVGNGEPLRGAAQLAKKGNL